MSPQFSLSCQIFFTISCKHCNTFQISIAICIQNWNLSSATHQSQDRHENCWLWLRKNQEKIRNSSQCFSKGDTVVIFVTENYNILDKKKETIVIRKKGSNYLATTSVEVKCQIQISFWLILCLGSFLYALPWNMSPLRIEIAFLFPSSCIDLSNEIKRVQNIRK